MVVAHGLTLPLVGSSDASATWTLGVPCRRPSRSHADVDGSSPIRELPAEGSPAAGGARPGGRGRAPRPEVAPARAAGLHEPALQPLAQVVPDLLGGRVEPAL